MKDLEGREEIRNGRQGGVEEERGGREREERKTREEFMM